MADRDPGRFTVHAHSPEDERFSVEREVLGPASEVELVLDLREMSKVVLAGRVTDALTGKALERFTITPSDEHGYGLVREFEDEEGRFEIPGLSAGSYTVCVDAEGYSRFELEPRRFEEGKHQLDFAVYAARSRALAVRNSAGDPISNAKVEILRPDGRRQWLMASKHGDSNTHGLSAGRATLYGLPAAPLVVRVTVEGELHEVDVDLTHPLEGELEIVIDLSARERPSSWPSSSRRRSTKPS